MQVLWFARTTLALNTRKRYTPTKHVDVIRGSEKSWIVMLFRSSSRKTVAPKMYGLRWFKTCFFRFSTWNSTAFCHLRPPRIRRKIATIGNHRWLVVRQDGPTWYTGGTRRMYWFYLPDLTGFIPVMPVAYQIDRGDIETVSFKT